MHQVSVVIALSVTLVLAGCGGITGAVEARRQSLSSAADEYDLSWVKSGDCQGGMVIRVDRFIDAPEDVVWSLVRDPNHYQDFNRALTAQVETMAVGAPISLDVRMFGDGLPPTNSQETVDLFDEERYVVQWTRDFGLDQFTHRPQFLEPEGSGTHYYTALRLPDSFGWLVLGTVGVGIRDAFARFAEGLDAAARARSESPAPPPVGAVGAVGAVRAVGAGEGGAEPALEATRSGTTGV